MEYDIFADFGAYYYGIDGRPIKRTPSEYPYSYDEFVTWKSTMYSDKDHWVYSDRMMEWDYNKFNEACMKVWKNQGQYFYPRSRTPKQIEKFLCIYFDKNVELTAVVQGCNQGNGYPYWVFAYREKGNN